jgi:F-type H+-transporting ATPase subunit delta
LGPEQRQLLETRISKVTGKKVILEYKTDESLLGGLVAEVGSLTFDDSLDTQLKLLNEELKRRAH